LNIFAIRSAAEISGHHSKEQINYIIWSFTVFQLILYGNEIKESEM
jgi:hypothetical protein